MHDVILHPAAFAEFQKAFRWYRRRSLNAAVRFDGAVQEAFNRIAATPDSFPLISETYRQFLLKRFPYSVVYRRFRETVHVLAIAHASRRSGYWKRRGDDPSPNGHRED